MIDYSIVKLENNNASKVVVKYVSLDHKLDFFMVIDSNKKDYTKIIENKILDFIIDKISITNTYKDFSLALEKINNIIKTYNQDNKDNKNYLNVLVSVLNKDNFIFSNIWNSSLYLIKETNETIEITDKNDIKKEFNYIFEATLEHKDILIVSSTRLLEYLSYSDFTDSAILWNVNKINKNIELILSWEKVNKNIVSLAIEYKNKEQKQTKDKIILEKTYKWFLKLMDNNFIKLIIAYFVIIKEKINQKSKLVKNLLLISWILVATILSFQILSKTIWTISTNENTKQNIELLSLARKYKSIASDSYSNPDIFSLNIKKSQEIIDKLKNKKIFLDDLKVLEEQLGIIKKTFNRVERWEQEDKHLIYKIKPEHKKDLVKILKLDKKIYLITKKVVIWPIINTDTPQINTFKELKNDQYISATEFKGNIILLTKSWKIVEFRKSWSFSFKDVLEQDTWEAANKVKSYANNIYLIWWENNQIFKHSRSWNSFKKAESYLKIEDAKKHKISDIAIDWWFYILNKDLSIIKFFRSPYRIETIRINDLPENYKKTNQSDTKIIARKDLNYVYILLNDRIWVFKPNTRFYKKTKSIKYLWQIESSSSEIKDLFVEKDWRINILNKDWIYSISFNENDGKIIVNN